jgi:adenylosuccinate lyase
MASATHAVEAHSTSPTTMGINTTAVATRFQVMKEKLRETAPEKVSSRHAKLERL